MKKAKIMLVAIAAIAVVGGALAFKARTTGAFRVCTVTSTAGSGAFATSTIDNAEVGLAGGRPTFFYTTTDDFNQDCQDLTCTLIGNITLE